jgi:hypothetical protein
MSYVLYAVLYRIVLGKPLGRQPLERLVRRWKDNTSVKVDLREAGCEDWRWMELVQDCVQRQVSVLGVVSFWALLP